MQTKRCPKCGETKSLDDFYISGSGRHKGRPLTYCKTCHAVKAQEKRNANPDKYRSYVKKSDILPGLNRCIYSENYTHLWPIGRHRRISIASKYLLIMSMQFCLSRHKTFAIVLFG